MPSYADLHKAKAVMGSMSYPQDLLDELASHPWAEQHSNDQDVQQHLDLGHALVAIPQRTINRVVSLSADGVMYRQTGFNRLSHSLALVEALGGRPVP